MTTAAFYPPFPGIRDAARRLALAFMLSVIAHLLLARSLALDVTQPATRFVPPGTLVVRIEPSAPEREPDDAVVLAPATTPAGKGLGGKAVRTEASMKQEAKAALALPRAPDPTYYSARDLDFYPRLAAPLELDRFAGGNATVAFRFDLLIDEQGAVREISAIEGGPPQLRDELRALLAATRFLPGQKDGRPVKSRVTLSVDFDATRRERADR